MKIFTIAIFVLMILAQWFIPLSVIRENEDARETGTPFKFKTQPIDPNDPFRGKYLTLSFEAEAYQTTISTWEQGQEVYVSIHNDTSGFAKISKISIAQPEQGEYFAAKVSGYYSPNLNLDFPFDRFYVEESKAKDAENFYNSANSSDSQLEAYAIVYLKNGQAYLHDVMVDEKSIVDWVREENGKLTDSD